MAEPKKYIVSTLKYRPQTFTEVTGQDHITHTLRNAIRRNRLANAYLFCGPRGVGKTSTARILAKAMNCTDLQDGEPCNRCESCRSITDGRSMDVIELDAASNRGIDEVRDLRENVRFPPTISRIKVYIIDEAHQLTKEAFNALLKTLEEPPAHAKFILATTEADKMLETIVSRCQQFRFKPLSLDQIVANLQQALVEQPAGLIPEAVQSDILFLIARASDGGMRDAQSLFDQVLSLAGDNLRIEDVEMLLGGVRLDTLIRLTEAIRTRNALEALELIHHAYNQGQDMAHVVRDLLAHFRNLMVCRSAPNRPDLVGLPADATRTLTDQSKGLSMEDLLQGMDILFEAERRLKVASSSRAVCEAAVVKLAKMPTTIEIEYLLGRRDVVLQSPPALDGDQGEGKKKLNPTPAPAPAASKASPPPHDSSESDIKAPTSPAPIPESAPKTAPPPLAVEVEAEDESAPHIRMDEEPDQDVLDTLIDGWGKFAHEVAAKNIQVGSLLADAAPVEFSGGRLRLAIPQALTFHYRNLNTPAARKVISENLLGFIGTAPEVVVQTATPDELRSVRQPVRLEPEAPAPRRKVSVDEVLEAEPRVQSVLDHFDGVVVDIKNNPNA